MRMSDEPTMQVSSRIEAPPQRVWEIISDVSNVGGWGGECVAAEWIEGGSAKVGARFRGAQRREGREWETTSTVTACEPGVCFGWAVGPVDDAGASWRFDLAPSGAGTDLSYTVVLGPGPSGITAFIASMPDKEEKIIANRLEEHRRNMTATLEAIKQAAEA